MSRQDIDKDTVSIHFARAAVARLSEDARRRVLGTAGVAEDLLQSPAARLTASSFSALWLAVSRETGDEFFGLDNRRMKIGSFALLCQGIFSSSTLDHAIKRMLRGFSVFLDDISAELSLERDQAVITVSNRILDAEARRFADETFLLLVHGLICWLVGRRIALDSAEFHHAKPSHAAEYSVIYCERLSFSAAATAVRFPARVLAMPIVQTATGLKSFLQTAPQSVFLKYKNEDSWTARIRRRLRESAGQEAWPTLDRLAHEFHAAPNTLRRRLDSEGTSYQDVKNQLRRDLAIHLLCSTNQSIAEIGGNIGFQEPSAFYRAFKRWTGVQPGEYRSRQVAREPPGDLTE